MQNLVFLNTFNFTYPANIQKFCLNVFSFLTFDVIYLYIYPIIIPYFNTTADVVINQNFQLIGLSSNFLILNMSTQFILMFIFQPVMIIIIIGLRVFFPRISRY
jgi:hypothetical protein